MFLSLKVAAMALCCLRGVSSHRLEVRRSAAIVFVVWVLYWWAWAEYSPARLLWMASGAEVDPVVFWTIADLIAAVIFGSWFYNEGRPRDAILCGLFTMQTMLHVAKAMGSSFLAYTLALDALWFVQIGVIVTNGSGGIYDRLHHWLRYDGARVLSVLRR